MHRYARRLVISSLALVAVIVGPPRHTHDAAAAPPPPGSAKSPATAPPPIRRLNGNSKGTKPAAAPIDATSVPPVSNCVKDAYARLGKEAEALAKLHAADSAAFATAYRARKEALVGKAALRVAGCKRPGEK